MKNLFIFLFIMSSFVELAAQSGQKSITLTPVVFYENSSQKEITPAVRNLLKNKMSRIITSLGLGSGQFTDKHIMFPDIQIVSKDVVPSAPPKVSITLDLTLYIGDYDKHIIYTSESFTLKGAGRNETKAYNNALKRLNPRNKKLIAFVENGKEKILDYYRENCEFVLNDARVKSNSGREKEALMMLTRIPYDSTDCYKRASDAIIDTYVLYENKKCAKDLAMAQSIWSASPNYDGAIRTQEYFSKIIPGTQCYSEAMNVMADMRNTLKEKDLREWKFKMQLSENRAEIYENILKMLYELEMKKAENSNRKYNSWWGK